MKEVDLFPPSINNLQFGRFLKNGETPKNLWVKLSTTSPFSGLKIRIHAFGILDIYKLVIIYYELSDHAAHTT